MDMITVTNWEEVDKGDFYLSRDWLRSYNKKEMRNAKRLQKEGHLYIAYEVSTKSYALHDQMDAYKIFIDNKGDLVMNCESAIIGRDHQERWESEEY